MYRDETDQPLRLCCLSNSCALSHPNFSPVANRLPHHRIFWVKDQTVKMKQNKPFRLVRHTSFFVPNSHPLVVPNTSFPYGIVRHNVHASGLFCIRLYTSFWFAIRTVGWQVNVHEECIYTASSAFQVPSSSIFESVLFHVSLGCDSLTVCHFLGLKPSGGRDGGRRVG